MLATGFEPAKKAFIQKATETVEKSAKTRGERGEQADGKMETKDSAMCVLVGDRI